MKEYDRRQFINRLSGCFVILNLCPKMVFAQTETLAVVPPAGPPPTPLFPDFNPFATPHHNVTFNKHRVYSVMELEKKIKDNNDDFLILSGNEAWERAELPGNWKAIPSHTEIIPIVGNNETDFGEPITTQDLIKSLNGETDEIKFYMNGQDEKFIPVSNYLNQFLERDPESISVEKVDGYKEVSNAIHQKKTSLAIGFRSESFKNMQMIKIENGRNQVMEGIPVTHTIFMRSDAPTDFVEEWKSTILEAQKRDLKMGGAGVLPALKP